MNLSPHIKIISMLREQWSELAMRNGHKTPRGTRTSIDSSMLPFQCKLSLNKPSLVGIVRLSVARMGVLNASLAMAMDLRLGFDRFSSLFLSLMMHLKPSQNYSRACEP